MLENSRREAAEVYSYPKPATLHFQLNQDTTKGDLWQNIHPAAIS